MSAAADTPYQTIAVIGAGAWGTALAVVAARAGREVTLWAREPDVVESICSVHENCRFLPGVALPASLAATASLDGCRGCEVFLIAAPAQHLRGVLALLADILPPRAAVAVCSKGIEEKSGFLLNEVLAQALPAAEAIVLSGPSFAREVALGKPTAVTIASRGHAAARLQASLGSTMFRPYLSDDLAGVALGGAAKNVYAIGCGMVEGAGLGENARAALLARSFAEVMRLGKALGARAETLMGLSGLGDLVLTAMSPTSRNYALGKALGGGASGKDATGEGKPLAEGAASAPALVARGRRDSVELPIAKAIADVLAGRTDVRSAADRLLARPWRAES